MRSAAHRRAQRGFTITEVLVATMLVGTSFVAVSWLTTSATRTHEMYKQSETDTLQLAREVHELAMNIKNEELSGLGTALLAKDIVALDSLDGATFSPPLRADGSVMTHLSGWSQEVDLSVHEKTLSEKAPMLKTANALTKPAKGSGKMYLLEVTILEGTTTRGSYEWLLKP